MWTSLLALLAIQLVVGTSVGVGYLGFLAWRADRRLAALQAEITDAREALYAANRSLGELSRKHTQDMERMRELLHAERVERTRVLSALGTTVEVLF